MSAEQERDQLIETAARLIDGSALDDGHPHSSDPLDAAERVVAARWRPPPSGDVVGEVASFISGFTGLHGETWAVVSDVPDARKLAQALAIEGYLRTPGCYDPIECGHEAALGEAEAKLENSVRWEREAERLKRELDELRAALTELAPRPPGEYVSIPVPPDEETVERVARAIYEAGPPVRGESQRQPWNDTLGALRAHYRQDARAALRALGEADHGQ